MRKFLIIFTLLLLSSCSKSEEVISKIPRHNYEEVEHLSYLNVFTPKEDIYYLYYYQRTCYHCLSIKDQIIDYALNSEIKFYFVEIIKDEGFISRVKEDTIGTNNPLEAFALRTPQLSLVENHYVSKTVQGEEDILLLIEYK